MCPRMPWVTSEGHLPPRFTWEALAWVTDSDSQSLFSSLNTTQHPRIRLPDVRCRSCTNSPGQLFRIQGATYIPLPLQSLVSHYPPCLCCSDPFLRSHKAKRNHPFLSGSPGFKSQVYIYLGKMLGFSKPTFPYLEKSLSPDSGGKPIRAS